MGLIIPMERWKIDDFSPAGQSSKSGKILQHFNNKGSPFVEPAFGAIIGGSQRIKSISIFIYCQSEGHYKSGLMPEESPWTL